MTTESANTGLTPDHVFDRDDPGDETQRRFRYQWGYGVILWVSAVSGRQPIIWVWCEHHDDFLTQKADGKFDSYQIKTRRPELGSWSLTDSPFIDACHKFVRQDATFPSAFDAFHFVSNVDCLDSEAKDKLRRSPVQLKTCVDRCADHAELPDPFAQVVADLAAGWDTDPAAVFAMLRRLRLVKGPSLDEFETVIAHDHLPTVDGCGTWTPAELNGLRDELIQRVLNASALKIVDPAQHWCCIAGEDQRHPRLRAKRLAPSDLADLVQQRGRVPFRFSPVPVRTPIAGTGMLEKKLLKGGLSVQLPALRRRTLDAERHLLELANRKPEDIEHIVGQLRGAVSGECADAHAAFDPADPTFGVRIYRRVVERLEARAASSPASVCEQPLDCLIGVAGLLTEECEVWWSEPFDTGGPL